ncbi:MAG: RNA recognition motif domain-containing protein [Akkermansiaceae bacterium]|jgi:cold-inducible RNA-binding protein
MKMYIGNLSFDTTKQDLETLFSEYGAVTDVHLPTDRESGRPRGFAFVTMDSKEAMNKAIAGVDGTDVGGRSLKVNEAQAREERSGGGGGGGYGGGNRGGNDRREERGGGGRRY